MKALNETGLEKLASAIAEQAVTDYRDVFLGYSISNKSLEEEKKDLEAFFTSDYYDAIVGGRNLNVIKEIKIRALMEEINKLRAALENGVETINDKLVAPIARNYIDVGLRYAITNLEIKLKEVRDDEEV